LGGSGEDVDQVNDQNEDSRILRAYCGDRLNPCPLNIEIASNLFNVKQYLNEEEVNLTNDKSEVIKYKNDLLFGYLSENEVVDKFEELKEKIKSETSNYEFLLSQYNEIVNNNEKFKTITKNTKEIYELIDKIRNTMGKYEKTDSINYVSDAVTLYTNDLIPKIKQNNKLKYKVEYVDFNEYDSTYNLIQIPYTEEDMEASFDNKVINLVTGLAKFRK
jgi:DNA repair exonuclease SbcCD ATPase subunit